MKRVPSILLIVFLSLLPLASMFFTDKLPHTSDGAMHLARIASYYKEIVNGQFPVRWASDLNYGYGTPIFNFFHPLPYYITTIFVFLGFSLTATLKISFLLSFIFSGIFMFWAARALFHDEKTAFWVTVFYQFAPFRLVDIFVRGSLGGIYSYTLLPLILYALILYKQKEQFRYFLIAVVSSALLSMSHNIVGFVFFGISAFMAIFIGKTFRKILPLWASLACGVLLASTFVIPAILEHNYTYGYLFTKDLFYNHFPKLYMLFIPNFTNAPSLRVAEVSVQIGFFHVAALVTSLYLLTQNKIRSDIKPVFLSLLTMSVVAILFMHPITLFLWEHISVLRQFQYPWRLMSVITFTSALLSASILSLIPNFRKAYFYIPILCCVVLSTVCYWNPPEGYDRIDESYYWNYPLTTNYYGEVDTIWSEGPAKEYPKNRVDVAAGTALVNGFVQKGITFTYTVSAETPATIVQRTQYFPGWNVLVDNQKVPIEFQDQNYRGLITYHVPIGTHKVTVQFFQSKLQRMSNYLSVITCIGLFLFLIYMRKKSKF